ncbi:transcription elongation factor GreA [Mycoplasma corogypsi]|uniref:transcription elongation factor GreA n=1 Tax=Mycoplasma corogypsi TaxID=2106 RepID=UPI0038732AD7
MAKNKQKIDNESLNYLSQETLEAYKKEYKRLIEEDRVAVQNALKEARAQGDLSENAEYDAARDRQSQVEGRINELEKIFESHTVIDAATLAEKKGEVGIGSQVEFEVLEVENKDSRVKVGERKVVTIKGALDADPFNDIISNKSPLAVAMLGKKAGATVEVNAKTKLTIKITKVESAR